MVKGYKAIVLVVGIVIADTGCPGCDQAGCTGGVTVQMENPPAAGPYRLEIAHPAGSARFRRDCTGGRCEAWLPEFYPSDVYVYRITGSDTTVWTRHLTYAVNRPNGEHCPPACRNANVTIGP